MCRIVHLSALSLKMSVLGIYEEFLTVYSNSAVAVIVGSGQEALGLFICQDTSTGGEPLEEIPAEDKCSGCSISQRYWSSKGASAKIEELFLNYNR